MTQPTLFRRLLIGNRGEVAARVASTCEKLGITPVLAVSKADAGAPYTDGRECVAIGPGPSETSYLDMERLVQAAVQARCTALHPGWGFLAENPRFAALVESHGVTFIGPPAHVMVQMGKKTPAKRAMAAAGLSLIPGSDGVVASAGEVERVGAEVGYPILIKAESGGGGRGMRVARSAAEVEGAFEEARREALAAFADDRVYVEKLIEGGRHVEIQIMADRYGNVVHLGERDCTVQRNHQKLIEESPAPRLDAAERERTTAASVRACRAIGYVGAGTMEFLQTEDGVLRFMEMNTRLQVEHCVTEMRCGLDLVAEQIRVAAGRPLSWKQEDIVLDGHAIECRINAEDPSDDFRPSPGTLRTWKPPAAVEGSLRIDTHVSQGYEVPPFYDSLLCKLISRGATRDEAISRMLQALGELECEGVACTAELHRAILASEAFSTCAYDTRSIPGWPPED